MWYRLLTCCYSSAWTAMKQFPASTKPRCSEGMQKWHSVISIIQVTGDRSARQQSFLSSVCGQLSMSTVKHSTHGGRQESFARKELSKWGGDVCLAGGSTCRRWIRSPAHQVGVIKFKLLRADATGHSETSSKILWERTIDWCQWTLPVLFSKCQLSS